jgi:hypothetical protein
MRARIFPSQAATLGRAKPVQATHGCIEGLKIFLFQADEGVWSRLSEACRRAMPALTLHEVVAFSMKPAVAMSETPKSGRAPRYRSVSMRVELRSA